MKLLLLLLLSTSAFAQFTALPPLPPVENAITTKGGLLTSNGTAQVEALACADDEIIVYDSAEANGFKCAAAPSGGSGKKCQAKFQTSNTTGEATGLRFSNLVVGEKYSVKYLVSGTASIKRVNMYVNGATNDSLILAQFRWNDASVTNDQIETRVFEVTQPNTDVRILALSGQINGSGAPWFASWAEICQEPSSTELVTTF
jgi:hypothetical protein